MTFGQKIRELRIAAGLSMFELGRRCGLPRTVIWKTEHGKTLPRTDTVSKIAAGFGMAPGSKSWKELHSIWGGDRIGHTLSTQTLAAGLKDVAGNNQKQVQAFLKSVSKLSADDFEEIRKALSRPAVIAGIRILNALFEKK
ncbi:MAG: helix-turn-helix transcriptional regulator [Verrucomicrobiae bacterium]